MCLSQKPLPNAHVRAKISLEHFPWATGPLHSLRWSSSKTWPYESKRPVRLLACHMVWSQLMARKDPAPSACLGSSRGEEPSLSNSPLSSRPPGCSLPAGSDIHGATFPWQGVRATRTADVVDKPISPQDVSGQVRLSWSVPDPERKLGRGSYTLVWPGCRLRPRKALHWEY